MHFINVTLVDWTAPLSGKNSTQDLVWLSLSAVKVGQRPEEAKCFIRVVKLAPPFIAGSLTWTHKPPGGSAFNSATFIPTLGTDWSYSEFFCRVNFLQFRNSPQYLNLIIIISHNRLMGNWLMTLLLERLQVPFKDGLNYTPKTPFSAQMYIE